MSLLDFDIWVTDLIQGVEKCCLILSFLIYLVELMLFLLLIFGRIYQRNHLGLGIFF